MFQELISLYLIPKTLKTLALVKYENNKSQCSIVEVSYK